MPTHTNMHSQKRAKHAVRLSRRNPTVFYDSDDMTAPHYIDAARAHRVTSTPTISEIFTCDTDTSVRFLRGYAFYVCRVGIGGEKMASLFFTGWGDHNVYDVIIFTFAGHKLPRCCILHPHATSPKIPMASLMSPQKTLKTLNKLLKDSRQLRIASYQWKFTGTPRLEMPPMSGKMTDYMYRYTMSLPIPDANWEKAAHEYMQLRIFPNVFLILKHTTSVQWSQPMLPPPEFVRYYEKLGEEYGEDYTEYTTSKFYTTKMAHVFSGSSSQSTVLLNFIKNRRLIVFRGTIYLSEPGAILLVPDLLVAHVKTLASTLQTTIYRYAGNLSAITDMQSSTRTRLRILARQRTALSLTPIDGIAEKPPPCIWDSVFDPKIAMTSTMRWQIPTIIKNVARIAGVTVEQLTPLDIIHNHLFQHPHMKSKEHQLSFTKTLVRSTLYRIPTCESIQRSAGADKCMVCPVGSTDMCAKTMGYTHPVSESTSPDMIWANIPADHAFARGGGTSRQTMAASAIMDNIREIIEVQMREQQGENTSSDEDTSSDEESL